MEKPIDHDDLQSLFDKLEVAILVVGRDDGIIRYINPCVCNDLKKECSEVLEHHYRQVFWPEFVSVYDRLVTECEDGRKHETIYYWAERALWEQISIRTVTWRSTPCVLVSITKISEIARSDYRFENMAYFDHMLKMPNGLKLEEDVNELASVETVALIYFEIERLEDINEHYGWENGDILLRQIRDWLYASETHRAQHYRVNNGFAILGRKATMEEARKRANQIMDRFGKPWTLPTADNNLLLYCTIKLGIVYGKHVRNEMRNLVLRTIRATERNKTGYAVYDEKADRQAKHSLAIRNTLINCVCNGMEGFEVHYQPIVETKSKRWIALEALCRWTMPNGEKVPPAEFIRMAEQLNLIHQIDAWVRETAMRHCVALKLDKRNFVLDINFSPTQKIDDTFIDGLINTLRKTSFPPEKLNLEITESAKMTFDEGNLNGLKRLQQTGIILSLDDFGTGYSSFANLIRMPAKVLKTEKLFLDDIESDPYRQHLLNMLAELAHYHDMHLVAEGVETQEQFELLRKYAVDGAQGYLFSTPLSFDQLANEVERFK